MHIDRLIFLSNSFLGNFSHLEIIDKPYIIYAFFFLGIFFIHKLLMCQYISQKIFYNIENNVWLIYL